MVRALHLPGRSATIADLERVRKERGYVGRGRVNRFEDEVLMPKMLQYEANLRAEQVRADDVGEHLLMGVPLFDSGKK